MNRPEPRASYKLEEGESKLTYAKDEKIPNAALFRINREDHTVGNVLRMYVCFQGGTEAQAHPPPRWNACCRSLL